MVWERNVNFLELATDVLVVHYSYNDNAANSVIDKSYSYKISPEHNTDIIFNKIPHPFRACNIFAAPLTQVIGGSDILSLRTHGGESRTLSNALMISPYRRFGKMMDKLISLTYYLQVLREIND